ncbi:Hypothetical protein PHPALM_7091 [Phytophthora palmivora]|uniref:Uncharacterized protein n=1 Tax=Phytophthora palmivora TaxID=4796 RepID=A0A2P4YD72_9STRA|nr:Hypothetical protein PHPALM_7091 [Phytophthora palmivora]
MQETQRAFMEVEKQLSTAREVMDLFVLEDTQLQMFALETRAKLEAIQDEVRGEMKDAMLEVDQMRQEALANATAWKKTLLELREATQKNEQILQNIREKKKREEEKEIQLQKLKAERALELLQELEKQRTLKEELERRAEEEMKRLEEIEKQRELEKQQIVKQRELEKLYEQEKQRQLEQLQAQEKELLLEREKIKEFKNQELEQLGNELEKEARGTDLTKNNDGLEVVAQPSDAKEGISIVKRVLDC